MDTKIREYYDIVQLMETGGFADAIADHTEQQHKEYMDINAPDTGIVDDDNPLQGKTLVDELREQCALYFITQDELKTFVAEGGVYDKSTPVTEYEDDFLEYLIDNIKKVSAAIEKRRGK